MENIYGENPLMLSKFVVPKRSLAKNQKELKIVKALVAYVNQNFEDKHLLLKSIELLNVLCNQLEDIVKKGEGLDKKNIIIRVYRIVFGETIADVDFIEQTIEYLIENKKIKKTKLVKKLCSYTADYLLKKAL